MRLIVWLFRAFLLFTLFAFALNNQQAVTVRWFFGVEWHTPLVIVVLVAFSGGCGLAFFRCLRCARRGLLFFHGLPWFETGFNQ